MVDLAYNNGYETYLKVSPFEVIYGIKCKVPLSWDYLEDWFVLGQDILKEMEEVVKQVRQNLKTTQDHQKSYADLKRLPK